MAARALPVGPIHSTGTPATGRRAKSRRSVPKRASEGAVWDGGGRVDALRRRLGACSRIESATPRCPGSSSGYSREAAAACHPVRTIPESELESADPAGLISCPSDPVPSAPVPEHSRRGERKASRRPSGVHKQERSTPGEGRAGQRLPADVQMKMSRCHPRCDREPRSRPATGVDKRTSRRCLIAVLPSLPVYPDQCPRRTPVRFRRELDERAIGRHAEVPGPVRRCGTRRSVYR